MVLNIFIYRESDRDRLLVRRDRFGVLDRERDRLLESRRPDRLLDLRGGGLLDLRGDLERDRPSLPVSHSSRTTNFNETDRPLMSLPSSSSTALSASSLRSKQTTPLFFPTSP